MTSIVIRILLITLTTATFAYHTEARATEVGTGCDNVQTLCEGAKDNICDYIAESVSIQSRLENAIREYINIHTRNKIKLKRELETVISQTQSLHQQGVPQTRSSAGFVRECTKCLGSNETNINYFGHDAKNALSVAERMIQENNNLVAGLFQTATKSLQAVTKVSGFTGRLLGSGEQDIADDLSRILTDARLDELKEPISNAQATLQCPQ